MRFRGADANRCGFRVADRKRCAFRDADANRCDLRVAKRKRCGFRGADTNRCGFRDAERVRFSQESYFEPESYNVDQVSTPNSKP